MSSPDGVGHPNVHAANLDSQAGVNAEGQHGGNVPVLTIFFMTLWMLSQEYLEQYEDVGFHDLTGADARRALLIVGVMAAHAFGEGSGVGVSFSGRRGHAQGTLVTIAIGLHNVPEGMAVATVMMAKGGTAKRALFWSLLCSMPQALVAVPSYLFVETFQALLPLALGFAAGCMIWIVCAELLPDALESASHSNVATAATFSAAWLQGLSMWIATLEQPGGHLASPIRADLRALTSHLLLLAAALAAAPCAVNILFNVLHIPLPPRLTAAMAAGAMLAMGGADLLAVTASPVGLSQCVLLGFVGIGLAALALKKPHVSQEEKSPMPEAPSPAASAAHPTLLANGNPYAPGKPDYPSLLSASPAAAVADEAAAAAAAIHGGVGAVAKCGAAELNGHEGKTAHSARMPGPGHLQGHVLGRLGDLHQQQQQQGPATRAFGCCGWGGLLRSSGGAGGRGLHGDGAAGGACSPGIFGYGVDMVFCIGVGRC
ncbi:hypothetical protein DUNSADRAFT_18414 [Dunaliella salina]|uniref:Uncharacterized protein n=1 Tax=Dunaliella salina TaxID=3046 RepID=A0ABQ7GZ32_DUNSA|nr:hypothetical protein DUNSADRAFT_18414 [Dunaliella salina]|eukprot:KAF5839871.1 hypothetical protein DUNSADRAFT_18414 [Dunaliella salina]